MATKKEALQSQMAKLEQQLREKQQQLEQETLAEMQAEELAQKSASLLADIATFAQKLFTDAGLVLPEGRIISICANSNDKGEVSFAPSLIAAQRPKAAKTEGDGQKKQGGGGGRTSVTIPADIAELAALSGKVVSWAEVAEALGIVYGAGSAHKAVFDKNKDIHDRIPHENCPYVK